MARQGSNYKPTDADRIFVSRSVKAGATLLEIAACLNIHDDTLRKHYRYEIKTAKGMLKTSAIGVLEDALQDGSLDAAKFILSRRCGWVEKSAVDLSGTVDIKTITRKILR